MYCYFGRLLISLNYCCNWLSLPVTSTLLLKSFWDTWAPSMDKVSSRRLLEETTLCAELLDSLCRVQGMSELINQSKFI